MSNHFYELTFTQFSHQITKKLCERGDHRTRYDTTGWAKHNAARAMLPSALGLQKQSKNEQRRTRETKTEKKKEKLRRKEKGKEERKPEK